MSLKTLRAASLAVALSTAAAVPVYMTTSFATAPQAQAFGLGDITDAAKKAGGAVKKGAKKVGGAAKKGAKVVGKGAEVVGKTLNNVAEVPKGLAKDALDVTASTVGKVIYKPSATVMKGYYKVRGKYDADAKERIKSFEDANREFYDGLADKVTGGIKKAAGKAARGVNHVIRNRGGVTSGESLTPIPKKPSRIDRIRMENGLADHVRGGGLKQAAKPANERHVTGRVGPPEGAGAKVRHTVPLTAKPAIGRDKSVFGRPVGVKETRKVQGIRLKDIKKRKHSKRRSFGRDKSAFCQPALAKKRSHKMRDRFRSRHAERDGSDKRKSKRF